MATRSGIEWTHTTWNPVTGCAKVSPGCKHCYAERMSNRIAGMARKICDKPTRMTHYLEVINEHGHWNNRISPVPEALHDPERWRLPRLVFVNSMSDLFHADVPAEFIQQVFAVMNDCARHTFQVLTKRAERLPELSAHLCWTPNIWMGVSVESKDYTVRIENLRGTGAAVKFLSLEPLLGPLSHLNLTGIDWVIVGGESGPGARPMDPAWALDIRDQCLAARVPFFFKQWGGVKKKAAGCLLEAREWKQMPSRAGAKAAEETEDPTQLQLFG